MTRTHKKQGTIALLLGLCASAGAADVDYRLKGTIGGVADGGRDFGLCGLPGQPACGKRAGDDHQQGYLDFAPWFHLQAGSWGFFLRPEAYAQTGPLLRPGNDANNGQPEDDGGNGYLGLKEAWIEYGGLTSYPGEWLRFGRQRIRQDDAQWWDVDIDSARWVFDTSQFQADIGGARQFASYRTDDPPIPPDQRDRTYVFGSVGGEPVEMNRITLRAVYAKDDSDELPAPGVIPGPEDDKLSRAEMLWIGLTAHDHYFDWRRPPHFGYYVTGIGQFGRLRRVETDTTPGSETFGQVTGAAERDTVQAFAAEAMGKICFPRRWPIQIGGGYTFSTGADQRDAAGNLQHSHQFFQTGVHSNYSRFTGTRSLIYRYNEAYRAELGNLNVATAFASIDAGHFDASAIFENFWRARGDAPVVTDGVLAQPVNGSAELGQGYDLVFSGYFTIDPNRRDDPQGEAQDSAVRLRGSLFQPGAAYGDDAHSEYRVMAEVVLWYGN